MCAARVHSTPEAQGDLLLDEQEVYLQKGDAQCEPSRTGDDERVGDEMDDGRLPPQALSFSGSGFLVAYHVGVVECLLENVPEVVHGARRVFGASAGSLIAAAVVCGLDLGKPLTLLIKRAAKQSRRWFLGPMNPLFNPLQIVRKGLVETLCENAYELACGRLVISMTRASDGQNVLVSDFSSNEELIQALLCSCFIPVYCGLIPPTFRGVHYIDGGLTNSQPLCDKKNTITISPFAGEIDICPRDFADCFFFCLANCSFAFTPENLRRVTLALFPPRSKVLQRFFWNGYSDTLLYLLANNMLGLDAPVIAKILSNQYYKRSLRCLSPSRAEETNHHLQPEGRSKAGSLEDRPSWPMVWNPKVLLSLIDQKASVIGTLRSLASHPVHNMTSVGQRVSRWFLHVLEAVGLMFKHDDRGTTESPNALDTEGDHSAYQVATGSV
ncbi:omega-hydroxyceramide transacylase-like [Pristis pectinata]|uniref:omega-hydroxyceramide transacylase-like n=1 Tax=Pristis pectinata TaxID=685728 RepID=UPI00223DFA15|nr:omega-hydroxyceramide transacylase-like [Pristis pectinata]